MFLVVASRVLHIAAACTSFGGLFYARAVLWPSLRRLPIEQRERFLVRVMRRFAVVKWTGIAVLVATGLVGWASVYPTVADKRTYLACFGLKMLGAIGLFVTTLLLALPLPALAGMQRRRGAWSALNLVFAGTILTGAALMRAAH